jgi:hypothetical protein
MKTLIEEGIKIKIELIKKQRGRRKKDIILIFH